MINSSIFSSIPLIFNDSRVAHMGSRIYRIAIEALEGVLGESFSPIKPYSGGRLYQLVDSYRQSNRDRTSYDRARIYYAGGIIKALEGERNPLEKTLQAKAILNTHVLGLFILQAKDKVSLSKHISYTLLPSLIDDFGKKMATKSILALHELDSKAASKENNPDSYVNLYRDITLQQKELYSFVDALDQLQTGISKDILINELLLARNRNLSKTAKEKIAEILQSKHYIDIKLHKKLQMIKLVKSYNYGVEVDRSPIISQLHQSRDNQLEALCHRGPSMFFSSDGLDIISLKTGEKVLDMEEIIDSENRSTQNEVQTPSNRLDSLLRKSESKVFDVREPIDSRNISRKREMIPLLPIGIRNAQNNCWYNTVLQILIHTPLYQDIVEQREKFTSTLPNTCKAFTLYEKSLRELSNCPSDGCAKSGPLDIDTYIPSIRKEAHDNFDKEFNIRTDGQEDGQQLLIRLLDHLSIDNYIYTWNPEEKIVHISREPPSNATRKRKPITKKYLLLMKMDVSIPIDLRFTFRDTYYQLHGVILHSGGTEGGHYFAGVKIQDSWYICNDTTIKQVSEKEMEQYIQTHHALLIASRIEEKKEESINTEKTIDSKSGLLQPEIECTTERDKPFTNSVELMEINRNLVDLEDQIEILTKQLDHCRSTQVSHIREKKKSLIEKSTGLLKKKIEFVKTHFPNNPVYALAIPRKLKQKTLFFTAGDREKIANLKENGIRFNISVPATGLDPSVKRGLWDINELGNRGVYFSQGEPAYLGDHLPLALGCELLRDTSGVSMLPVSVLKDSFGFSAEEINKGYDQIQKEFAFLQHDGFYPANTEVVFIRNENILCLNHEFILDSLGNIMPTAIKGKIHDSWFDNPAKNPHIVRPLKGQIIKKIDNQGRAIVFDETLKREVFFKPLRAGQEEIVIEAEIAASSLAHSLLGNLVPPSYRVRRNNSKGLGQKAIDFGQAHLPGAMGTVGANSENAFDITALTQKQLEQLFAHSLVDWILSNIDVFPHNFGIDKKGNIVAFDKAQSYKFFNGSKVQSGLAQEGIESNLPKLQPNFSDLQEDKSLHVHALLRDQLKKKKIRINFEAPIIQQTIHKIKSLNKEQLATIFEKYAKLAFPNQEKDFIDSIFDRCQDLDRAVKQFKNEL